MKPQTLQKLRRYHLYLGVFFAPAIMFFSISGSLQTFQLHEEKGYGGTPPNWIVWLASVHKDQAPPRETKSSPSPAEHKLGPPPPSSRATPRPSPLPLKIFVLLMALGLFISALVGLTIALASRVTRRRYVAILFAGAVAPIVLLWL